MKNKFFAVLAVCFVLFLCYGNFSQSYINDEITVYMSIDCKTVMDNYDRLDEALKNTEYIPADGIILEKTVFKVKKGSSVLDFTKAITKATDIQLEYSQSPNDAYVQGINYLYEFSCGDLSGWMYSVNGEFISLGCDSCILNEGDTVLWQYTCDLGKDLKEDMK